VDDPERAQPVRAASTSLSAVSCTSAGACTAAGYYSTGVGEFLTLAERWNGKRWAIQPTPNPNSFSDLTGVSCTSATACTAVGFSRVFPDEVTLAERWSGTKWVIEQTPNVTGYDELSAVSCASATACAAVGCTSAKHTSTLAERWNGSAWAVTRTPKLTGNHALSGVSCTSARACTAVGNATSTATPFGVTLAERWNGRRWTVQPTPSPGRYTDDTLSGLSCTSAAACTAVGSVTSGQSSLQVTLAEAWNGRKWAVQPTSKPGQGQLMWLSGVSCPSAAACVAAGYNGAAAGVTLAEAWNGTAWASQRTPNPTGAQPSALSGISCPSAGACMAAGHATNQASIFGDVTMAERWNGSTWTVIPAPSPAGDVTMGAVSCTSATACTLVGSYASGDNQFTLAER
jgi:hypothetical protein